MEPWDDPRSLKTFSTFCSNRRPKNSGSKKKKKPGNSLPNSSSSSETSEDSLGAESTEEVLVVVVVLSRPEDRRFGFSVVGGTDEGIRATVDTVTKGSPADRADLEVGDEILEVNGRSLENCTHTEVISHIHQCIRSRTICLRVKRKAGTKLALDLASNSNVQDAFVIAVEQQARERLERLSALKKIKPVDMTKLSQELNQCPHTTEADLNGVIHSNSIYVTSVPDIHSATLERANKRRTPSPPQLSSSSSNHNATNGLKDQQEEEEEIDQELEIAEEELELKQEIPEDEVVTTEPADVSMDGQHREMAVDVPDSFVGVTKTPPRYPPPKPSVPLKHKNNGSLRPWSPESESSEKPAVTTIKPFVNGTNPVRPLNGMASVVASDVGPKDDHQIERIRKYQEDIKKRREEEERIAKEEEFLRSSLRGSKKLQALESSLTRNVSGVVNSAFELEEGDLGRTLPIGQKRVDVLDGNNRQSQLPELTRIIGATELLESLQRIEAHIGGEEDLSGLRSLFATKDFKKLLEVHNKVQDVWCFHCPPTPCSDEAENLTQQVMNSLQECSLPEAAELIDILSKYEFEGLMFSHDKVAERQVVLAMTPDEELLDKASQYTEESVKIVRIDKSNEPLGATVRNEGEAVVIGRIVRGGAAEKSGLLHEGDEILEVNSIEMRGKSVNDVCDILATMTGTLTFLIVPTQYEKPKVPNKESIMHIKAHFDYDPDDDLYIPCRELGIGFQKGDILHVINQDDANWWQAYREGEDDQTLAGLIPSKCFQQQREAMKQTIVGGEPNNKEKSKRTKFLCAKKQHKKKKKKVMYNANNSNEGEDEAGIMTYEEVSLFRPRANRKRPIVLIGPHNIGRQELRQRLMENTERFAAAVPHTSRSRKDPEVDGVDYHFISRLQFEADILGGKFVEHGEYEKSYYGTSLDAIRAVVNSGKICVLNLHPQSLKILKNSDLKPYIVLVAPPSLERLRHNRVKMGASAKDDELKGIIEKAREMEDNYSHYFDMVLINSDVDKAYSELLEEINTLEKEPQWVPTTWLKNEPPN